jgi:hypothetical protein
MREILKMEDDVSIQKLVHESMNRLKNRCESDESGARVHESYSQIFDSFDSRFLPKIPKIRVQITPPILSSYDISSPKAIVRLILRSILHPFRDSCSREGC